MTPAEQRIREAIEDRGPLRFDEVMQIALYEPEIGYYQSHIPGEDSAYQTSPSLTPWFGRLLARRFEQMWRALDRPCPFTVVEVGAGNAALATAALASVDGQLAQALRWNFVEPHPPIRDVQRERMGAAGIWVSSLEEVEPAIGCLLANEVLDNFPVRLFEVRDDGPHEIYVGIKDELIVEIFRRSDVECPALEIDDRFELNNHIEGWCKRAASAIELGYMLVIDYGDLEPAIFMQRPAGTIVTYRKGVLGVNPLVDLGDADITSHVNFSALGRAAEAAGFVNIDVRTQRTFLQDLGVHGIIDEIPADTFTSVAERSRVAALVATGGLGDLLVFEAEKGLPSGDWPLTAHPTHRW